MKKLLCILLCLISITCVACGNASSQQGGNTGAQHSGKKFTQKYIEDKTGYKQLSSRDFDIDGVTSHNYWYGGPRETNYDRMEYYLFDSKSDAQKAFSYMKEVWIDDPLEQDEQSIEGLCYADDANLYQYIYWNNNLVIVATMQTISTWVDESDDYSNSTPNENNGLKRDEALIEYVRSF